MTFVLVLMLSNILSGQFWKVPSTAILAVYVGVLFGLLNPFSLLRLGETLIHEIGHAQMAAFTLGSVKYIRVERDTSGVTFHTGSFLPTRLRSCLVSLFGPIASSVLFVITARLVASELTVYWALGIGVFTVLILISTVRNIWGWITGLVVLLGLYIILESSGYFTNKLIGETSLATTSDLIVIMILGIASFNYGSSIKYSLSVRKIKNPNSDEYKFSKSLFLPHYIGSRLIILCQLLLGWIGLGILLGWPSIFDVRRLI